MCTALPKRKISLKPGPFPSGSVSVSKLCKPGSVEHENRTCTKPLQYRIHFAYKIPPLKERVDEFAVSIICGHAWVCQTPDGEIQTKKPRAICALGFFVETLSG